MTPLTLEPAAQSLRALIVDDDPRWGRDPVEQARAACRARVPVVQLRAKRAGDRTVLAWAREIRALTRAAGSRFVVNDRFDLALLAEADAVHLGQDDLPPSALPREARARLAILQAAGFAGTWTVEFTAGVARSPEDRHALLANAAGDLQFLRGQGAGGVAAGPR